MLAAPHALAGPDRQASGALGEGVALGTIAHHHHGSEPALREHEGPAVVDAAGAEKLTCMGRDGDVSWVAVGWGHGWWMDGEGG